MFFSALTFSLLLIFVFAQVGEERILRAESRRVGQDVESEITPLELAFAQVAPLRKGYRRPIAAFHGQRVAVHQVDRQHMEGSPDQIGSLIEIQVAGKDVVQVGAAFGDVVRQQLDAVDTHQRQQRIVPSLEFGLAVFQLHGGKFALKHLHQEVAAATGGLQEACIDAVGLFLHEVEHGLDHPRGREDFSVIGNALFGLDEGH